jgi:chaperone required for assembly of F1-ATPase
MVWGKVVKRFWKEVRVIPQADGFAVTLDGMAIKTPAGEALVLPAAPLAEAIAGEWQAQGEMVNRAALRLTRLANTAIDRVRPSPGDVVDAIAAYGRTDLLCHRADGPDVLRQRQADQWQPVLDWAAADLGVRLLATEGVMAAPQHAAALARLRDEIARHDVHHLAALQHLTALSGSVILALAVLHGRLDGATAWAAARLDEDFQAELWGRDAEAEARAIARKADFDAAARYLALLGR